MEFYCCQSFPEGQAWRAYTTAESKQDGISFAEIRALVSTPDCREGSSPYCNWKLPSVIVQWPKISAPSPRSSCWCLVGNSFTCFFLPAALLYGSSEVHDKAFGLLHSKYPYLFLLAFREQSLKHRAIIG